MHPAIATLYTSQTPRRKRARVVIYDLTELATWEEDKHPRDHGKFAEKPGGKDAPEGDSPEVEQAKKEALKVLIKKGAAYAVTSLRQWMPGAISGEAFSSAVQSLVDAGMASLSDGKLTLNYDHKVVQDMGGKRPEELPAGVRHKADAEDARRVAKNTPTDVSREELQSLRAYVHANYGEINGDMRRGVKSEASAKGLRINGIIGRTPPLEKPVPTYRGMEFNEDSAAYLEAILDTKPGDEIEMRGLVSTSLSPSVAAKFTEESGVVFEIMARQGIDVNAIESAHSDDSEDVYGEAEFLLGHGSRFRVVGHVSAPYLVGGQVRHRRTVQLEQVA